MKTQREPDAFIALLLGMEPAAKPAEKLLSEQPLARLTPQMVNRRYQELKDWLHLERSQLLQREKCQIGSSVGHENHDYNGIVKQLNYDAQRDAQNSINNKNMKMTAKNKRMAALVRPDAPKLTIKIQDSNKICRKRPSKDYLKVVSVS